MQVTVSNKQLPKLVACEFSQLLHLHIRWTDVIEHWNHQLAAFPPALKNPHELIQA